MSFGFANSCYRDAANMRVIRVHSSDPGRPNGVTCRDLGWLPVDQTFILMGLPATDSWHVVCCPHGSRRANVSHATITLQHWEIHEKTLLVSGSAMVLV